MDQQFKLNGHEISVIRLSIHFHNGCIANVFNVYALIAPLENIQDNLIALISFDEPLMEALLDCAVLIDSGDGLYKGGMNIETMLNILHEYL